MTSHFIAIVEEAGPETAAGLWFPDLPGCFSAGDDIDEALANAPEAVALYAQALADRGERLPAPRSLMELRNDPEFLEEIRNHLVALVSGPETAAAAE